MGTDAFRDNDYDATHRCNVPPRRRDLRLCGAIGYPVVLYLASGAEIADEGAQVNDVALGKLDRCSPPEKTGRMTSARTSRSAQAGLLISKWPKPGSSTLTERHVFSHSVHLAFNAEARRIQCPCHGGQYDSHPTGNNFGGGRPPPLPLRKLEVVVEP